MLQQAKWEKRNEYKKVNNYYTVLTSAMKDAET